LPILASPGTHVPVLFLYDHCSLRNGVWNMYASNFSLLQVFVGRA